MPPDSSSFHAHVEATHVGPSFARAVPWFLWSARVAVFVTALAALAAVCGLPAGVTNDPWDRTTGSATFAMSVPLLAWLGLLTVAPARRELEPLDPLVIGCVPFTAFLWLIMLVRMVETGFIPGT